MAPSQECPRCKGFEDKALVRHNVAKCRATRADFTKLWKDFDQVGEPAPAPDDASVCKAVFNTLKPGDIFDGKALTKHSLEAMHQKAFAKVKPVKQAFVAKQVDNKAFDTKTTSNSRTPTHAGGHSTTPDTVTKQQSSRPSNIGAQGSEQVTSVPWKLTFTRPNGLKGGSAAQSFKSAVWPQCPVNNTCDDKNSSAARVGSGGQTTRVATNYLAVNSVPKKLYEYSVKYVMEFKRGTTPGNDQIDAENAMEHDDSLSMAGIEASLPNNGTSHQPQQSDQTGSGSTRQIKRRTEQRLVWEALKTGHPFATRQDWATDFGTVWSLKPLFNPNTTPKKNVIEVLNNVKFRRSTGREATVDQVQFTFVRELSFTAGSASQSLINSGLTTDKGASVHITALNGLISQHATDFQPGIITQVGPNKFFLCSGFQSMDSPAQQSLPPLNAHRGYYSSIRPGSEKVLLNISTKCGAFFNPMPVSRFITAMSHCDFSEYGGAEGLLVGRSVRICYDRLPRFDSFDPNEERNRHKTVASIGDFPSVQTFWSEEKGREISVLEYYRDELRARPPPDDSARCVNVGLASRMIEKRNPETGKRSIEESPETKGKQIWIPVQYLELDANQPFIRRLVPYHMDAMLLAARHHPAETQHLIANEGLQILGLTQPSGNVQHSGPTLTTLGLSVDQRLLEIPGRFLALPRIMFRNDKESRVHATASWAVGGNGFDMLFRKEPPGNSAFPTYPLKHSVHIIDLSTGFFAGKTAGMGSKLTDRLYAHGLQFTPDYSAAQYWSMKRDGQFWIDQQTSGKNDKSTVQSLNFKDWPDKQLQRLIVGLRAKWGNPDVFCVLLERNNSDEYAKVKRVFDQHLGLHTVCLTATKLRVFRGELDVNQQLLSNLCLKINMKLRGQAHQVSDQRRVSVFSNIAPDTIVLGADVSHAPSKMAFCPSVASVVGNDDKDFANFPGSMRLQGAGQEIIEDLAGMVFERVVRYTAANRSLPKRMIFYRDGVGEDQFAIVREKEIKAVREGFEMAREYFKNHPIHRDALKLTFIVVGKRHHTCFFCRAEGQSNESKTGQPCSQTPPRQETRGGKSVNTQGRLLNGNVRPGLIVDTVITRPPVDDVFDFFLQSHEALQGTAKSGHYTVLERGDLSVNEIQGLTYGFCYNYARATKGVSYAGPAYYADRLCERGTHYLKAYTAKNDRPPTSMTDIEKRNGKEGAKAYAKRVAEEISKTAEWNPHRTTWRTSENKAPPRTNPWHPRFDDRMFWL